MNRNWVDEKLSNLINITHGYAFKSKDFAVSSNSDKPIVLTPGNYTEKGELCFSEKNTKRLSGDVPKEYLFDIGDLTVVMTDLSSKMKILGKPAFIRQSNILHNQRIGRVIFKDKNIYPQFLYYYLFSPKVFEKIKETSTGTMVRHTAPKRILALTISLPPIKEQKRIVAILDEAFAGIDTTIANTEKNLASARELFLSKKSHLFQMIEKTAQLKPLPIVCEEIFAGGDAPKDNYSKIETDKFKIPIFANAVKDAGLYGYTDFARALKPSITVAARGSGTGHIELRRDPFLPIVRLIVLTPNEEKLTLEYLMHTIQNLDILRSGSAIPQLTVPMIKEYSIPVPAIIEQNQIVEKLEELSGKIVNLESIYRQKLISLSELKQSLLQKAFAGELTAEDNKLMNKAVA